METTVRQSDIEYQSHSLIDFLLGDGMQPGWLDKQGHSPSWNAPLASQKVSRRICVERSTI